MCEQINLRELYEAKLAEIKSCEDEDQDEATANALAEILKEYQWRLPRIIIIDELESLPVVYVQVAPNVLWRNIFLSAQVDQNQDICGETDDEGNAIFQPTYWYGQFHIFNFDVFEAGNFNYLQFNLLANWIMQPTQYLSEDDINVILDFMSQFPDEDNTKIIVPPGFCVFRFEMGKTPEVLFGHENHQQINFADLSKNEILDGISFGGFPWKRSIRIFDGIKWHKVRMFDTKFDQRTEKKVHDPMSTEMHNGLMYLNSAWVEFEVED